MTRTGARLRWPAALVLLSTLLWGGGGAAKELIHSFHSEVTVSADSSMLVRETIRVRAEGEQIRRGIYRDLPTTYKDRLGNRYSVRFSVVDVKRDGAEESWHQEKRSNGVRVYMGGKDRFLKAGDYTYELTYRTDRQLGYFDTYDELYWNVTGNGWDFPIGEASCTIELPAGIPSDALQTAGYTGPMGSTERAVTVAVEPDGRVTFRATRSLGKWEGLTVAVGWPKGFVTPPSVAQRATSFFGDNLALGVCLVGILVLLGYYTVVWRRVGRDPEAGTIIPRFAPPQDLSPAAVRYIRKMGFDHDAFAAAVIHMAVQGYLTILETDRKTVLDNIVEGLGDSFTVDNETLERAIEQSVADAAMAPPPEVPAPKKKRGWISFTRLTTGKLFVLRRCQDSDETVLSEGERALAQHLFSEGVDTLVLYAKNHKTVRQAIKAIQKALKDRHHAVVFHSNSRHVKVGVVISLGTLAGMLLTGNLSFEAVMLTIPSTVALLIVLLLLLALWGNKKYLFALPLTAIFGFGMYTLLYQPFFREALPIPLFICIAFLTNGLFFQLLKAPTPAGRQLMDEIEGFREYLAVAEADRLRILNPPEKTPELFERYLPYALALDVAHEWAESFSDVLQRVSGSGEKATYQPTWYRGRVWSHGSLGSVTASFGSSLSAAIASSSSAPGSRSGSGGGGSSGGGGGGGGGGGW